MISCCGGPLFILIFKLLLKFEEDKNVYGFDLLLCIHWNLISIRAHFNIWFHLWRY